MHDTRVYSYIIHNESNFKKNLCHRRGLAKGIIILINIKFELDFEAVKVEISCFGRSNLKLLNIALVLYYIIFLLFRHYYRNKDFTNYSSLTFSYIQKLIFMHCQTD